MSVLTVGGLVFSSDPRLAVTVSPEGRIWQLEISNVSLADEGDYQCQVNTHSRLSSIHNLQVIGQFNSTTGVILSIILTNLVLERPRANPRSSTEYSLNEAAIPDIEEDHHAKADIVILKENPVDIKQNPSSSTVSPPSPSTTTATTSTSSTRLPKLSSQSYRVPQEISSTNILLVLMSAFSLVVFAIMTAGCSLGLYRKYKYPELSGSRPASRTGTLDSRGSSGSSGSRRSRRQSRRERDDEIYSEVRVKSEEDDIRTRPGSVISDPPLISPTQQRQRVSFSSFQTSRDRRLTVSLASTESLSLTSGQDDSLKPHGKKIRFNPYDEFSD